MDGLTPLFSTLRIIVESVELSCIVYRSTVRIFHRMARYNAKNISFVAIQAADRRRTALTDMADNVFALE